MPFNFSASHLTFDDEFNSFTSSPDGSTGWQTTFYFGGRSLPSNGEQEYYSDSSVGVNPFSVQNGELTITAAPGSNPEGLAYNSGLITTEGDFTQTYGYFEIRAEVPAGQGMWPGFWLLPADKSWPPEIDVLEAFGATNANGEGGANQVHVNALTTDYSSGGGGDWVTIPGDIYTGYHTYGVDWEHDYITYYIDGAEVYQVTTPSDMNMPMYMLANLAVGGPWVGNATGETGQMKIDYIRAYSSDSNTPTVAPQPISSLDGANAAPSATGSSSGSGTVVLHVSEDAFNGDAKFTVSVDGQQIGDIQTVTAIHSLGQWQDITLNGNFDSGAHTVSVNFINDAWGGTPSTDRNLYVQYVDVNGEHIAGNTAQDFADSGWGPAYDPTAAVFLSTGSALFSASGNLTSQSSGSTTGSGSSSSTGTAIDPITLHVSEDAWNGDAQFTVFVDGQQMGGVQTTTAHHGAGQWQDIVFTGDFGTGPHAVSVNFINDAWGGTQSTDRNLYVQYVDVNGEQVAGNTAINNAANGAESADPSAAVMMTNGTAVFNSTGNTSSSGTTTTTTTTTTTSTLTLHVAEDAWNGDAQFLVFADGHQVGGVQTATASHGQGQWQDITLSGELGTQGPATVDVVFINDGWGGTTAMDRNLYVQSIDVNGVSFAGTAASDNAANGGSQIDPHAAVMMINGTTEFAVNHTAPPTDWHV